MVGLKLAQFLANRLVLYMRRARHHIFKMSSPVHLPVSLYLRWRRSVITVNGVRVKIDNRISPFMVSVIRLGKHSMPELAMVLDSLDKDDVVLELGGGVGYTSICYAKKIGSERVHTVEANPELTGLMQENFKLNNVSPVAKSCMLGHSIGEQTFMITKNFWASSNIDSTRGRSIKVPVLSINDTIREINPTFLVMDIEGGERELFDGLDFFNIRKIMLETHRSVIGEQATDIVLSKILNAGFEIGQQKEQCYLFTRKLPESGQWRMQ